MLENGSNFYMPVAPANSGGFGNGFGGDGWWILLLLLFAGGWGNGFGGFGGGFNNDIYPWMNQTNQINNGFRDQMLNDSITSIRDGVQGLSTQLCNSFAAVEQGANARQMADMQQMFSLQSALQNCCCENRLATANLNSTIISENCADRQALNEGVRDIITNQTASTQAIIDKLCQLELDGKNTRIADLERQLTMADLKASQTAQNAFIAQGLNNEVDALYNRLSNCPVPSVPVYGRQPIFSCNNGCGCGCSGVA